MDIKQMTAQERQALKAELEKTEIEEKQRREEQISTYKSLIDEEVKAIFPILITLSESLAKGKAQVRDKFQKALEMKAEIYGIPEMQRSHTFSDSAGKFRITIGVYTIDNYDDTVDVGISKVKDYLKSLAKDKNSEMLVDSILKLLAKDNKGTLKASRVLQLEQLAHQTGDPVFLEGVKIIKEAYQPLESKSFVKAEYKDECGTWCSVPLGMTESN